MNAGGRDSGSCDERRDHSLAASHAKLSGFKVGRTAGLSYATPAVLRKTSADFIDQCCLTQKSVKWDISIRGNKNQ